MVSVAAGIIWAGYTMVWWGMLRVKGCPAAWSDLTIPASASNPRYVGCAGATPKPPKEVGGGPGGSFTGPGSTDRTFAPRSPITVTVPGRNAGNTST